ncbi:MAG TPA: glycosyltransferase family 4 protein [Steroidobacteraceae bacterium]|nr:glycosyltransferase family 4 protein [Steroidobacteraceae bacterium]
MKIAQVAPLAESVPPRLYGGTERIVSYLTEELVRQGHAVTLFASGDSRTAAELHAIVDTALRFDPSVKDAHIFNYLQLEHVRARAEEFDVVHFHTDYLHFPLLREFDLHNALTTLHGRLDLPGYREMFGRHPHWPVVSISNDQRRPLPDANWVGTVLHGLPRTVCDFRAAPSGEYLAFLGRISPEKRVDRAIEIARRAGMKLRIAAKVDAADERYFHAQIEPLLSQPHVEYVGEIGERDKCAFLGGARALLFPIDWPEPFGLVMIESMSCGTPVVAWRGGSVPEIVNEGINGFIVDSIEGAVDAVQHAVRLDRARVRASFEERFTVERMTHDYLEIYRKLAARKPGRVAA